MSDEQIAPVPPPSGHPCAGPAPDRALRTAVVWRTLRAAVGDRAARTGRPELDIVDAGGGTGNFAVPLAELGHRVTVVDPNPDSLAALERRAADAGVTARVRPVQAEAADLPDVIDTGADLLICHSVLEYVDDPAVVLAAAVAVARPGAAVSVLIANPVAAALHRALAGQFDDAARLLADPHGTWGERDPMPRRFTRAAITSLLTDAGLTVAAVQGVRVFADLVPGRLLDADPGAADSLAALEQTAAGHPALGDIATQLHVLAHRRPPMS